MYTVPTPTYSHSGDVAVAPFLCTYLTQMKPNTEKINLLLGKFVVQNEKQVNEKETGQKIFEGLWEQIYAWFSGMSLGRS